jgi:hypothetical protein
MLPNLTYEPQTVQGTDEIDMFGRITTCFMGKSALWERCSDTHISVVFSVWRHLVALKSVGLILSRDPRSQDNLTCIIFHECPNYTRSCESNHIDALR